MDSGHQAQEIWNCARLEFRKSGPVRRSVTGVCAAVDVQPLANPRAMEGGTDGIVPTIEAAEDEFQTASVFP
jgi:hypothetical protein